MRNAIVFILTIALLAACNNTRKDEPLAETGTKVRTAKVQTVIDKASLGFSGTVEASQVIPLSFRTTGTVSEIFVEVGDNVKKGQLLATLDDSDLQNIYNTMLAKYKQAEDAYNRLKQVYDEGSLPEIKWVEMQSNYDQAKSALELSKNNLEKCRLLSPVSGIVGRRNIEPGQSAISLAGAPIELVKIEKVLVKISVPENEINQIGEGDTALVTVSALGGKSFDGQVTNVSPVAELMSRTYTVKITLNNPDLDLKPGMVCDVSLESPSGNVVLLVPKKAVNKDHEGKTFVFVVDTDQETVRKQIIKVGQYYENGIIVMDGLIEGQNVVCEGIEKLSDNSKIVL